VTHPRRAPFARKRRPLRQSRPEAESAIKDARAGLLLRCMELILLTTNEDNIQKHILADGGITKQTAVYILQYLRPDLTGFARAVTCGGPACLQPTYCLQSYQTSLRRGLLSEEANTNKDFFCEGERQAVPLLSKRRMRRQV
jgi:hypothetical protein